jgi:hypothetical protein
VPRSEGNELPATAAAAGAAGVAFVAVAFLHLPLGYLLRYARIDLFPRPVLAAAAVPVALAAAFLHEAAIRGTLYGRLRAKATPGLAAPLIALAGVLVPLAARFLLFPAPGVPFPLVGAHAFLVEYALSLGLTWLALGAGSIHPGAWALAAIWVLRVSLGVRFHGGPLPLLELLAACAAALLVTVVLAAPLAPHRDRVLGAG